MKAILRFNSCLTAVLLLMVSRAQTSGPYDPENWPPTVDPAKKVHYVVTDGGLPAPSGKWLRGSLQILTTGDQATANYAIGGHTGKKALSHCLNVADSRFTEWANVEVIDILVEVWGDTALFDESGQRIRYFTASRAHHADVGGTRPGSMAPDARTLAEEGVVIPPTRIGARGVVDEAALDALVQPMREPAVRRADLAAQIAAARRGGERWRELVARYGAAHLDGAVQDILGYAETRTRMALADKLSSPGR